MLYKYTCDYGDFQRDQLCVFVALEKEKESSFIFPFCRDELNIPIMLLLLALTLAIVNRRLEFREE